VEMEVDGEHRASERPKGGIESPKGEMAWKKVESFLEQLQLRLPSGSLRGEPTHQRQPQRFSLLVKRARRSGRGAHCARSCKTTDVDSPFHRQFRTSKRESHSS